MFELDGKVAIVTGAGRGIGKALAGTLAGAGATVVPLDIDGAAAEATRAALNPAIPVTCSDVDVADANEVDQFLAQVYDKLGSLDVLVNNAGINVGNDTPAEHLPLDVWQRVLEVNLTAPFICSQRAARIMIAQGGGKIINIASAGAVVLPRVDDRYPTAYCVSKAGLIMLTRSLALQWAPYGINVNAISPGYTDTGLIQRDEVRLRQMVDSSPFARLGQPSDLAGATLYLASEASSFMTGHNLVVDGGYSL
jgi:NAD(P)-dependent dehydrogenase (short-subunit alcohol dehydrogenase family)